MNLTLKGRTRLRHGLILTCLLIFGVLLLMPFVWMIIVSFDGAANLDVPLPPRFYPKEFSFFNIQVLIESGQLVTAYKNSFIVAVCAVIVDLTTVLLGGYALSKGRFRGRSVIVAVIMATMMVPFETRMIPMFAMFNQLKLMNSYRAMIIPAMLDGFGILMAKQYFDKLPDSLRESAFIGRRQRAYDFSAGIPSAVRPDYGDTGDSGLYEQLEQLPLAADRGFCPQNADGSHLYFFLLHGEQPEDDGHHNGRGLYGGDSGGDCVLVPAKIYYPVNCHQRH